jgi:D-glycero-D-manno-heptose 1,7-bisphosphate phosphatase
MKLVILDRDGVINADSSDYIKSPQEWHALPGSLQAIARLNQANIKVAIASNQSGVGRGYFTRATLNAIHDKLMRQLAECGGHIDKLFVCPHVPDDACDCRKPQPGLLLRALRYFEVAASDACFVGDSLRDLQAAQAAECQGTLVLTGNGMGVAASVSPPHYNDLAHFVDVLLEEK